MLSWVLWLLLLVLAMDPVKFCVSVMVRLSDTLICTLFCRVVEMLTSGAHLVVLVSLVGMSSPFSIRELFPVSSR